MYKEEKMRKTGSIHVYKEEKREARIAKVFQRFPEISTGFQRFLPGRRSSRGRHKYAVMRQATMQGLGYWSNTAGPPASRAGAVFNRYAHSAVPRSVDWGLGARWIGGLEA